MDFILIKKQRHIFSRFERNVIIVGDASPTTVNIVFNLVIPAETKHTQIFNLSVFGFIFLMSH